MINVYMTAAGYNSKDEWHPHVRPLIVCQPRIDTAKGQPKKAKSIKDWEYAWLAEDLEIMEIHLQRGFNMVNKGERCEGVTRKDMKVLQAYLPADVEIQDCPEDMLSSLPYDRPLDTADRKRRRSGGSESDLPVPKVGAVDAGKGPPGKGPQPATPVVIDLLNLEVATGKGPPGKGSRPAMPVVAAGNGPPGKGPLGPGKVPEMAAEHSASTSTRKPAIKNTM